jgi:hypothetical protein
MNHFTIALISSAFGGFLITGPLVFLVRRTGGRASNKVGEKYDVSDIYSWSVFWLGSTERAIATTLYVFAPAQLPVFIAGWSAAKIAAGWGRLTGVKHAEGHMSALVGTAWSFSIAIAAGPWASPSSLAVLAK